MEAIKNFPAKMESLTKELRAISSVNKELHEQISDAAQIKKNLRNEESKLQERQRDVLNRQRLLK